MHYFLNDLMESLICGFLKEFSIRGFLKDFSIHGFMIMATNC